MVKQNHPQFDRLEAFALSGTELGQRLIGWGNPDDGFRLSTFYKGLNGRECATRRTAEDKVLTGRGGQEAEQIIAGIAPVKEQDTLGRNMRQQGGRFLPFKTVNTDDGAGDRQATEHIIEGRDQTLGIMAFAGLVKTAFGIELVADRLSGWEGEFRPVDRIDRHAVPGKLRVVRPAVVGDLNGMVEGLLKDLPGHFLTGFTQGTAMGGLGLRPQAASTGCAEHGAKMRIDAIGIALANQ